MDILEVIQASAKVSREVQEEILAVFKPLNLEKNEILLGPNDIESSIYFVEEGVLTLHYVKTVGTSEIEWIERFIQQGEFTSTAESRMIETPFRSLIMACTPAKIKAVNWHDYQQLLHQFPELYKVMLTASNRLIGAMERRMYNRDMLSARQRYEAFAKEYPMVLERVRLRQIANYLGITPQTLSHIRRRLGAGANP